MDYAHIAADASIKRAADALAAKHFNPIVVATGADALAKIKELVPAGVSVMNGASVTLEKIGYTEYLKSGKHPWRNLHANILAEKDPAKQAALRRQAVLSDWYLGSAHALTEAGDLVFASNSGSQLPHLAFTSPNILLVVGAQKIVPALPDALARIASYVVPLEDERMMQAMNRHTAQNKTLILHGENPAIGRTVHVLIVKEPLGF